MIEATLSARACLHLGLSARAGVQPPITGPVFGVPAAGGVQCVKVCASQCDHSQISRSQGSDPGQDGECGAHREAAGAQH